MDAQKLRIYKIGYITLIGIGFLYTWYNYITNTNYCQSYLEWSQNVDCRPSLFIPNAVEVSHYYSTDYGFSTHGSYPNKSYSEEIVHK